MTSSLVGSEMCIRDRLKHWCKEFKGSPLPGLSTLVSSSVLEPAIPCLDCLLYTSDAADDM
eukprot:11700501-Prorocentrum_lima.AAC.1